MSAKHTPEPWAKAVKTTQIGRCFVIDNPDRLGGQHGHICCIYDDNTSLNMKSHEEHEANANLIAAAPELLEALKRAEPALWIMATSGHADAVAIHAECRAAIARAEGGQS